MTESSVQFMKKINEEINSYSMRIDLSKIRAIADLIQKSERLGGRVHLTGIGKPSYVAGYIASLLSSTGTCAYLLDATEAVHGSSGQVRKGDVVIAISNSGQTKELQSTISALSCNGAFIVSLTGNTDSWLAEHSSICLEAKVAQEGDSLNKPPRASILVEIMALQTLSVELQERKKITKKDYLKWHPGGSIGKSLQVEEKGN